MNNEENKNQTPKPEEVTLPKKTLETILARLESIEEQNKQLQEADKKKNEQIEMLTSVADKARLARYQDQTKGPLIRTARVSFWQGVPVLAWSKVKDEVGFQNGRIVTNQVIKLFLDEIDEETKQLKTVDIDYLFWAQNVEAETGEVVEKSETEKGQFWTIQMKDGRKIKLDIRFINAF